MTRARDREVGGRWVGTIMDPVVVEMFHVLTMVGDTRNYT